MCIRDRTRPLHQRLRPVATNGAIFTRDGALPPVAPSPLVGAFGGDLRRLWMTMMMMVMMMLVMMMMMLMMKVER